nr:DNA mismatch repair protein MutS [Peptoniphilus catoniae]
MMKQYLDIKKEHKDKILLFRLGDFYEMFFEDALIVSKELDLTLTKRASSGSNTPMCGFPYHVAQSYISRLINRGYKVAICEQVEDPKLAKSLVKREVIQVLTPGTFTDPNYLKGGENNFLLSLFIKNNSVYISYSDYSTGELYTTSKVFLNSDNLIKFFTDEYYRINPSEILINKQNNKKVVNAIEGLNTYVNYIDDFSYDYTVINEKNRFLINKDIIKDLDALGSKNLVNDFSSVNILLNYLAETQKMGLNHLNSIVYYDSDKFMTIDENSRQNLELVRGSNTGSKSESLLGVLDNCKTSMGSRELKKWIEEPLKNKEKIEYRYEIIDTFIKDFILLDKIASYLKNIYDIERLSVKIAKETVTPKDLISLADSLDSINKIKEILATCDYKIFNDLSDEIEPLSEIKSRISEMIMEDPPANFEENPFIRTGFSEDLDQLFDISSRGKEWILKLEDKERKDTGIKNLKIKYNKILGYFIEVTKSFTDKVPDSYIRKQTLVGSERYFCIELKEMESKLLTSREDALKMQMDLFNDLRKELINNIHNIQILSKAISKIDILASLADTAIKNNYVKPIINNNGIIDIKDGRHAIVEKSMTDERFIANDTILDNMDNMIHIITGPNMAGKSTYMRQVAIIVIMAQIGSFVPASYANISIIDKLFTRIGASDNLSRGESTFMVEMKEVANIINNATKDSLVILDEVGRGTSTYDGISLAWAIVENIAENIKAKTLFATHYHELVELSKKYKSVTNLTIEVENQEDNIIFLRKIVEGYSDNSYGIEVAKLAGINESILNRANEILYTISEDKDIKILSSSGSIKQESLEDPAKNKLISDISQIDINNISPLESLNLLNKIIQEIRKIL